MGVEFTCPECGQTAVIISGGFVVDHAIAAGRLCSFKRTARSNTRPKFVAPEARVQRRMENLRKEEEARERKAAKRAAETAVKPKRVGATPQQWSRCGNCGQRVALAPGGSLRAHRWVSNGRWCKGGAEPTAAQRRKAAAKKSIWTVSGGLPTLGGG